MPKPSPCWRCGINAKTITTDYGKSGSPLPTLAGALASSSREVPSRIARSGFIYHGDKACCVLRCLETLALADLHGSKQAACEFGEHVANPPRDRSRLSVRVSQRGTDLRRSRTREGQGRRQDQVSDLAAAPLPPATSSAAQPIRRDTLLAQALYVAAHGLLVRREASAQNPRGGALELRCGGRAPAP